MGLKNLYSLKKCFFFGAIIVLFSAFIAPAALLAVSIDVKQAITGARTGPQEELLTPVLQTLLLQQEHGRAEDSTAGDTLGVFADMSSDAIDEGLNVPQSVVQQLAVTSAIGENLRAADHPAPTMATLDRENVFVPEQGGEGKVLSVPEPLAATTIINETFEGPFPGSSWTLYGNPTWDDESYAAHGGSYSGWCGGSTLLPANGYANSMNAWMVYGPFSLADATSATMNFWYKNVSEINRDWFKWVASVDGTNFYGYQVSGDQNSWRNQVFDLASVPTLGDLRGRTQVWVAFIFSSDGSITGPGAYVDDIVLTKDTVSVQADLTPYKPTNWNDKIPIGTSQLAGSADHSYTGAYLDNQTLYFNFASLNQGSATASGYTVHVEVTGTGGGSWNWTGVTTAPAYYTFLTTDQAVGPLSAGSHTFKVWVDYNNTVGESNENNNYYERTITVSPTSPGTVQFKSPTYAVAENNGSVQLCVSRMNGSYGAASVNYATANGTAVSGTDYTGASGTLNWANADAADKCFNVTIIDDAIYEGNKTFTASLSGASGANLGSPSTTTVTITENEPPPPTGTVQFNAPTYTVAENAGSVQLCANRMNGSYGAASVNYATANGTAVSGTDYIGVSGTLSWANADAAEKCFTVTIIDDGISESDKTFTASLSGASGASLGSPSTTTVTIISDEMLPTVIIIANDAKATEARVTKGQYLVKRTGATTAALTVKFVVTGTATSGSDYISIGTSVTIPAGVRSAKVTVKPINDTLVEGDETVSVTLSADAAYTVGSPASATVTIKDDDGGSTVRLSPAVNDFDGDGRSDYGVFDMAQGLWQLRLSTEGEFTDQFGTSGSVPVTGDFDGDGRSDYGVFATSSGLWSLRQSTDGDLTDQLGSAGSVPVTGDFDGDGRSDYGVYDAAEGLWQLRQSTIGDVMDHLGSAGSVPVTGDFDGDKRSDYGVFDPAIGVWSLRLSTEGNVTDRFGSVGTAPVIGDFDGDGKSDCGCYTTTTGRLKIALSSGGLRTAMIGDAGAIPIVGDFDGDGTTDFGSYSPALPGEDGGHLASPGLWQIMQSTDGLRTEAIGDAGAIPIGGTSR